MRGKGDGGQKEDLEKLKKELEELEEQISNPYVLLDKGLNTAADLKKHKKEWKEKIKKKKQEIEQKEQEVYDSASIDSLEIAASRLKKKSWLSIAKPTRSQRKDEQIRDLIARVRELKAIDSGQLSTIRDSQSRVDMIGNLTRLVLAHEMAGQVIDTEERVSEKHEKLTLEQRQMFIKKILEKIPQDMLSKMPSNKDGESFKKNLDQLLVKADLNKKRVVNMYQNIKEGGEQTPPSIQSPGLRSV